jgi:Rrf2 family nitric oxide-sensitive transcriptional repressor
MLQLLYTEAVFSSEVKMQLTKHTDYAFRILIYLLMMERETATIKHITERFQISKSHVMKIVNKLTHKGWLHSVRGKNGGIRLACEPKKVSLREVVELMETTLEPVNCSKPACLIMNACNLKGALWQAQQAYLAHLDKLTLDDLINKETHVLINQEPDPASISHG